MEDNKEKVINEPTKSFKSYNSEEEYNNEVKSISSKAKNELLKELGVTKLDDIRSQLAKAKEFEDAQKTDIEKYQDQIADLTTKNESYANEIKNYKLDGSISETLGELGVDSKYSQKIKKLVDASSLYEDGKLNTEKLKELVTKEAQELNLTAQKERVKVGNEIKKGDELPKKESALDRFNRLRKEGKI